MSYPLAMLGTVATFINGDRGKNYPSKGSFIDEGIPFISAGNLSGGLLNVNSFNYISDERFDLLSNGKVKNDDILFCLRGSLGKFAVVKSLDKGAIASSLVIIRNNENIQLSFLKHYLGSPLCRREIDEFENGAAQPNLSAKDLKNFKIPLPPLPEQKKIAEILDAADSLKQKDQQLVEHYDSLSQSLFLDMFGDPVHNPKKWGKVDFASIGTLDRGKSKHRPRNDPTLLGGEHPLIQTGDVANSNGYLTTFKSTYSDLGLKQSKMWPAGTLCITIAANIAKTGILTFDACFPDSVVGFVNNDKSNIEYVKFWMSFLQKVLEDSAPMAAQKNINLKILRELEVSLPPIELQNLFEKRLIEIEKQKKLAQQSLQKSEDLFNSLLQKAFKGELTAS